MDAACALMAEFTDAEPCMAVIKHTNACGLALRPTLLQAWHDALAGDRESAFGGVLISNTRIDADTATAISELFFEILVAPAFDTDAMAILQKKKNRILLAQKKPLTETARSRTILNGTLTQDADTRSYDTWTEAGARPATATERSDLQLANLICKHLKSNAIALVKDNQLVGKGCGQTSRIDALRQSLAKAEQAGLPVAGAVMASDAFFLCRLRADGPRSRPRRHHSAWRQPPRQGQHCLRAGEWDGVSDDGIAAF